MGRFLRYHLCYIYNMTETTPDRLCVRIAPTIKGLEVCHGFLHEQETILLYNSSAFVADRDTGLWVLSYTERVVRVCEALLIEMYDYFNLWYVPPDIIALSKTLGVGMAVALGYNANVRQLFNLLDVIDATQFDRLPRNWQRCSCQVAYYYPRETVAGCSATRC